MKYLFCLFLALGIISSHAQTGSTEIGLGGGASYYIGDLNPIKHFYNPKFAFTAFYRENINDRISLRLSFAYGNVAASDADAKDEMQNIRNLNFKSSVMEIGPIMEINFMKYTPGNKKTPGTPYIFYGLTYFRMDPKAMYDGSYISLQPLGTEGQETSYSGNKKKYKTDQLSIPVGLGLKFNLSDKICLAFEYGIRKTFTDYLDDVSGTYADPEILAQESSNMTVVLADQSTQAMGPDGSNTGYDRGNSANKDWYSFSFVTLSVTISDNSVCTNAFR